MAGRKRAVKDVPIFVDTVFDELKKVFNEWRHWNYKTASFLTLRDKALFSFLVLAGPRASEAVRLKKKQVLVRNTEVVVTNFETLKRGKMRYEIVFPRTGRLAFLTEVFVQWIDSVPGINDYVFPRVDAYGNIQWDKHLSRKRVWQIINSATGLFPHWFRGVHETIMARLVFKNDAWKLKDYMGYRSIQATEAYVRGEMDEDDKIRLRTL